MRDSSARFDAMRRSTPCRRLEGAPCCSTRARLLRLNARSRWTAASSRVGAVANDPWLTSRRAPAAAFRRALSALISASVGRSTNEALDDIQLLIASCAHVEGMGMADRGVGLVSAHDSDLVPVGLRSLLPGQPFPRVDADRLSLGSSVVLSAISTISWLGDRPVFHELSRIGPRTRGSDRAIRTPSTWPASRHCGRSSGGFRHRPGVRRSRPRWPR